MKLNWKQIDVKLFGLRWTFTLPLIEIIVRQLDANQVERFRRYKEEMAECPRCHRLFDGRAGNSFILHLVDAHNMSSYASMNAVGELYHNLLSRKEALRQGRS